ncbi:MAG: ribosome-associated translation inhibitor RaiA [Epsilonproteobacteria bacterium]|nr:ribosome-associated translation inhibitor RaiA [Campylobacterota bacterium]
MNTSIVGRHFELSDPIKDYIDSAFESIKKYNLDIISANAVIAANERNGKKGYTVEFVVNVKDKHTIVITQKDKDVYAAIDKALERLQKSLRRYADKVKDHRATSIKDLEQATPQKEPLDFANDIDEDIVPMDLEIHKPLDFEEARALLAQDPKKLFLVFYDNEGNLRVMYKRSDGKYGLY